MPGKGENPELAAILRFAAALPESGAPTWLQHFREQIAEAIELGTPTLERLARQLGYASPRSVRRALRRWDRASRYKRSIRAASVLLTRATVTEG